MTDLCSIGSRVAVVLPALAVAACTFHDPDPNELLNGAPAVTEPSIIVDAQAALSQIANQAYTKSPAFTQASTLYPSTKDPVDIIEWVSADAAAAYAQIAPDVDAADVSLPTGSIVVRAVYALADAGSDGAVQYLTVLVKGPPGTNPIVGDWWFGVTDPDGNPLLLPDGGPEVGFPMTGTCESCHNARGSSVDYLFGVPASDRASSF
ncbi:MAG TPA: hypothetical protein VEK07_20300 [Polyangiaceae bacterium]|nr:hypothetical protein [Polyangiaceae bacterium]